MFSRLNIRGGHGACKCFAGETLRKRFAVPSLAPRRHHPLDPDMR